MFIDHSIFQHNLTIQVYVNIFLLFLHYYSCTLMTVQDSYLSSSNCSVVNTPKAPLNNGNIAGTGTCRGLLIRNDASLLGFFGVGRGVGG